MTERLLSFDPGDPHVGWAIWELLPDQLSFGERWKCMQAGELTPEGFIDMLRDELELNDVNPFTRVAGEEFKLFADVAMQQTGSSFGTVEVIGAARHLCRWANMPFELVTPSNRDACFTKMKAVGYRFPKDAAGHAKSAICVGAVATGWRAVKHYEGDGVG